MVAQFVVLKSVLVEKKIVSLDKIEGKRGTKRAKICHREGGRNHAKETGQRFVVAGR